ncbi:MAG TPA: Txe/YoeB family addiction module toxin [Longimicrobium sp.]|nr:Txe/YoeB family addiction module toxin [Longimicrobium sp.]
MTAAKRRATGRPPSPAVPGEDRQAIVHREFWQDLAWWIGSNPRTALRVMRLIEEIIRDPFVGIGKPEALKHRVPGECSRRITDSDRLVYLVQGAAIYFLAARSHYGRH